MEEKYTRRDYLAMDRTHLANERTLMAYIRTTLAFLALAAFVIKFLPSTLFTSLALISMLFGAGLAVYGVINYLKYKNRISKR